MTRTTRLVALVGPLAAVAALTGACGGQPADTPPPPSVAETPTTTPTPPPPLVTFGDGAYAVGVDVTPGTYRSEGAVPGSLVGCYWERRAKDPAGGPGAIIANGFGRTPVTVTVTGDDGGFTARGCLTWNPVHGK